MNANHKFEVFDGFQWTKEIAFGYQIAKGYHPHGYSLVDFKAEYISDGRYKMTWECYGSCD